jgi:hypothetical protein
LHRKNLWPTGMPKKKSWASQINLSTSWSCFAWYLVLQI